MGLETVELVMGFEEAFGIDIPDAVASELTTPRHVVDYIASLLPLVPSDRCLSQQTFYKLRHAFGRVLPEAPPLQQGQELRELATKETWPTIWTGIVSEIGDPGWPAEVPWRGWLRDGPRTVRELVWWLTTAHIDGAGAEAPWTRERIQLMVRKVVREETVITDFRLGDSFVRDMGLD